MPHYARILIIASIAVIAAAGVAMHASRTQAQLLFPPPPPPTVTFNYDSVGRIVREVYPANSVAHDYDAAGNRATLTVQ